MLATITGTGNGSAPVVNITFPYLDKAHVKAEVDGVAAVATWTGTSQVTFASAVPAGSNWKVYRDTPTSPPVVDFTNGSVLAEADLDKVNLAHIYRDEELSDIITLETSDRAAAVVAEATSRANADAAEATSRANADAAEVTARNAAIADEAALRAAQDAQLSNQIAAISGASISVTGLAAAANRGALSLIPASANAVHLHEAGRAGTFEWDPADHSAHVTADPEQGLYIAPVSDLTGASGAWVRKFNDHVVPEWWGAVGDFDGAVGTDNASAFAAMLATLKAVAGNSYNVLNPRGPRIVLRGLSYYVGSTISLKQAVDIQGVGSGLPDGKGTRFVFPANTHGVIFNRWTTDGEVGQSAGTTGSDTSIVRGLRVEALKTGVTEGNTASGFYCRAPVTFENCQAAFFAQDGFVFHADESGTFLGNANGSVVRDSYAEGNGRDGFRTEGNNANAVLFENVIDYANGGYGKRLMSAAGNTLIGGQGAGNGVLTSGLFPTTSMVNDGAGNLYAVMPGQAVAASTTAPGTNPAVWTLVETGAGTDYTSIPLWFSGIATTEGGAGYIGVGLALDPYSEARQSPYYVGTSARMIGGSHGYTPVGPGLYDRFQFGTGYVISDNLMVDGSIATQGSGAAVLFNGRTIGNPWQLYNDNNRIRFWFGGSDQAWLDSTSGAQFNMNVTVGGAGSGLFINSRDTGAAYQLYNSAGVLGFHNGSLRFSIDATGNVNTTAAYQVNGTKVLGARSTGWAADTGTAKKTATATYSGTAEAAYTQATVQTLMDRLRDATQTIKALKDALIAHGIIGT